MKQQQIFKFHVNYVMIFNSIFVQMSNYAMHLKYTIDDFIRMVQIWISQPVDLLYHTDT